jgi:hypothetical protein
MISLFAATAAAPITVMEILKAIEPTGISSGDASWPLVGLATIMFLGLMGFTSLAALRVRKSRHRAAQMHGVRSAIRNCRNGTRASLAEWEKIRQLFSDQDDYLKRPFDEYHEQIWLDEEQGVPRNEEQAEAFFSEPKLDPGHESALSVPSILTALGILGTFIGITVGLMQIDLNPPEEQLGDETAVSEPLSGGSDVVADEGKSEEPSPNTDGHVDPADAKSKIEAKGENIDTILPTGELPDVRSAGPIEVGTPAVASVKRVPKGDKHAEHIQASIQALIQSLGVSFRTSIWGVFLSVLSTLALVRADHNLQEARMQLVDELDESVLRATPVERLMRDQRRLVSIQESALVSMKKAANSMAEIIQSEQRETRASVDGVKEAVVKAGEDQKLELQNLGDNIGRVFEEAIHGTQERDGLVGVMQGAIRSMTEQLSKTQSSGVSDIVGSFMDRVDERFGASFTSLSESIDCSTAANQVYIENMGQMVGRLEAAAEHQGTAVERMNDAVTVASTTIQQLQASALQLEGSAGTIREAADQVKDAVGSQTQAMQQQSQLTTQVTEAMEVQASGWAEHRTALSGAYSEIQAQFDGVAQAVNELRTWHEGVRVALGDQLKSWNRGIEGQIRLTETLGLERQGFSTLVGHLQESGEKFGRLATALQGVSDKLQSEVGELAKQESSRHEGISGAVAELRSVGSELGEGLGGYVEAAKTLQGGIPEMARLMESMSIGATQLQSSLLNATGLVERFEQVVLLQDELKTSLTGVVAGADATRQALEPGVKGLVAASEGLANADRALRTGANNLSDLATQLTRLSTDVQNANATSLRQWDTVQTSMSRTSDSLDIGLRKYSENVNSGLSSTLSAFDKELSGAVLSLSHAMTSLKELVEDFDDAVATRSSRQ